MNQAVSPSLRVAAVVLAAGSGSRLGTVPKSMLMLDGVPLIRRLLSALFNAGVHDVVVVLGHHAALIEPALHGLNVATVHNPQPDAGAVSSQRLGLAALDTLFRLGFDACIVALADQPLLDAADISALIQAFAQHRATCDVLVPQVSGQRGNPVIFSDAVRRSVLSSSADVGCRDWQTANPQRVLTWDSGNTHYVIDIDTPEDLARFAVEQGRALHWPAANATPPAVEHNAARQRFELTQSGQLATCDYRREGNLLVVVHTGVPAALEGRGLAAALVSATLAYARSEGLQVRPVCSYVAAYMRRHPETADLLA